MTATQSSDRLSARLATACPAACALVLALSACGGEEAPAVLDLEIAGVGFMTPESVLHDPDADVYLVSNIAGDPFQKDDDGFVSRLSPEGQVLALRWIDGASDNVDLDAPKGMAILGDELWIADIDQLRRFDRKTGAQKPSIAIPGPPFLNDVAVGPDGVIHVTDSGFAPGFTATATDAIWRVEVTGGTPQLVTLARGEELAHPNGICSGARDLFCVDWDKGEFVMIGASGKREASLKLPHKQLDGLVRTSTARWFASSWEGRCIYEISPKGEATVRFKDLDQPADIGWDEKRSSLLVPLFGSDSVLVKRV